jgi:hypothetical protein
VSPSLCPTTSTRAMCSAKAGRCPTSGSAYPLRTSSGQTFASLHCSPPPAAVRWLSCEPLLGPVNLHNRYDLNYWLPDFGPEYEDVPGEPVCQAHGISRCRQGCRFVDWVVAGGESGVRGARPMAPHWARPPPRPVRRGRRPVPLQAVGRVRAHRRPRHRLLRNPQPAAAPRRRPRRRRWATASNIARVGKKTAGRELDGRTWDEYPVALGV